MRTLEYLMLVLLVAGCVFCAELAWQANAPTWGF